MENGPEHRRCDGRKRRGQKRKTERWPEAELTVGEDETKHTPWTERLQRERSDRGG